MPSNFWPCSTIPYKLGNRVGGNTGDLPDSFGLVALADLLSLTICDMSIEFGCLVFSDVWKSIVGQDSVQMLSRKDKMKARG